jgi:flagellar basal-body rod modification protein FlgD
VSSVLGNAPIVERRPGNELDKDAFLQLLVAQLRYQDPTAPMDSASFMAQTSQLTSVEKLTDLATTSRSAFDVQQRLGAASLVGRQVSWTTADGGSAHGTVDAVTFAGGSPVLRVGDTDLPLDQVTAVAAPATQTPGA